MRWNQIPACESRGDTCLQSMWYHAPLLHSISHNSAFIWVVVCISHTLESKLHDNRILLCSWSLFYKHQLTHSLTCSTYKIDILKWMVLTNFTSIFFPGKWGPHISQWDQLPFYTEGEFSPKNGLNSPLTMRSSASCPILELLEEFP